MMDPRDVVEVRKSEKELNIKVQQLQQQMQVGLGVSSRGKIPWLKVSSLLSLPRVGLQGVKSICCVSYFLGECAACKGVTGGSVRASM